MTNLITAVTDEKVFTSTRGVNVWSWCSYLGTLTFSDDRQYECGIWTSIDDKSHSLTFVDSDDHTQYHSVPIYRNKKLVDPIHGWDVNHNSTLTLINQWIYTTAQTQGLFEGLPKVSRIRASITKAGLLYKHPDLQSGWPESWNAKTYGSIGYDCAVADISGIEDDYDTCVNCCAEPMMAVAGEAVKHLVVSDHPDYTEWLLFYNDHVLGLINQDVDGENCVELINPDQWKALLNASGFKPGKMDMCAAYDPKIYLTEELHKFVMEIPEEYDPYR
jgi:hypothetical protein